MRVIAGTHGGRRLFAPPGKSARPTGDRVKEALFSVIGPFFEGGVCLDLFAGSGALGIEALSRGVERAVFVDRASGPTVMQNLAALGLLERLTDRERDVFNYLTDGYANKVVAYQLGISPRTVEVHRARILEKLDASCLADLVRIAQDAELRGTSQAQQTKI